jgi:hypothetical protein
MSTRSLYPAIIESIFLRHYREGAEVVPFGRTDIEQAAGELGMRVPKNLGDLIYSFRFRTELPESVRSKAPSGKAWSIRLRGRATYAFVASVMTTISPRADLALTKIPNATPGIIDKYALSDEQALLAKVRYNRIVDIFTGIACYSLQSHLRTTVPDVGQVETDEVYVGVDRRGVHYVLPVQAKGGRDRQSVVQVEQDIAMCRDKFPAMVCRPLAAQFVADDTIAMFELEQQDEQIVIASEKHYQLVSHDQVTEADLAAYMGRCPG